MQKSSYVSQRLCKVIKRQANYFVYLIWAMFLSGALFGCAYREWSAPPVEVPTLMPALVLEVPPTEPAALPTMLPSATAVSPNTPTPSATPTLTPTATLAPTATSTPTPTLTPNATLAPNVTPSPTLYPTPQLVLVPGQPQSYLDKFRLVAFYGSPTGPGLGILGNQSRAETLALLRQRVAQYQPFSPERPILPTYHMIVAVANLTPPYYYANLNLDLIEEWVTAAEESGVAVILDIQPGQGDVLFIYKRVRHLLFKPHVHLAIDPEFVMGEGQVPGQVVGSLSAATINAVQEDLDAIGVEIGLNRVLILHQFAEIMLPDKENIIDYAHVELIIDGDGVGSPGMKKYNYNNYAQEPAFEYGGFKLFPTDGDYPVLTPQEVMTGLQPPPVLIIYQ